MTPSPRRILLTGATRGLGRALAERFIALGHVVLGCGRAADAVADLARRFPAPHDFAVVDVADAAVVDAWAARLLTLGPPPDLLLNNAAIINRRVPLWELPAAEFGAVLEVNVKGTANVLRAFLPAMVARRTGIVVNFSSTWGRSTAPGVAAYCAAKYAVEGLSLALAQELPEGMACVPLNPGIIDTDMLRSCSPATAAGYPNPDQWVERAAPFLLRIRPQDNGRTLTIPE